MNKLTEKEWEAPKFWIKETIFPERVVRKVDPFLFLRDYCDPLFKEFAKSISAARLSGKCFKAVAYISFPQIIEEEKNEKAEAITKAIEQVPEGPVQFESPLGEAGKKDE
jgi:hypothetical protein